MLFCCLSAEVKITSKAKMNESADDCSHEFDYQSDFTQFLKEARQNVFELNLDAATNEKKQLNWEKKHKKSWKKSLFSWLKNDNRSKSHKTATPASKARRRAHVSGPITRSIGGISTGMARWAASGPLTGLFGSTGSPEEGEVPYMCLGEVNRQKIQAYGPVYLVT